jgi:hypothetical protein
MASCEAGSPTPGGMEISPGGLSSFLPSGWSNDRLHSDRSAPEGLPETTEETVKDAPPSVSVRQVQRLLPLQVHEREKGAPDQSNGAVYEIVIWRMRSVRFRPLNAI